MDDTIAILRERDKELLPLTLADKYLKMCKTPYHFFRGSCTPFYQDLSELRDFPTSPFVWTCGDLHPENAGTFADANGKIHFDLNDFDEAALAPALWELARFCCSILSASQSFGLSTELANGLVSSAIDSYCQRMQVDEESAATNERPNEIRKLLEHSARSKRSELLSRRTDEKEKLSDHKKHVALREEHKRLLSAEIQAWLIKNSHWPNARVTDICFRKAGLGSLGLPRYLVLTEDENELRLFDLKAGRSSSVSSFAPDQPLWPSEAGRIAGVQSKSLFSAPAVSTFTYQDLDYVVQEFQPQKKHLYFKKMSGNYAELDETLDYIASLSAAAQLRTADWQGSAPVTNLVHFSTDRSWKNELMVACRFLHEKQMSRFNAFRRDYVQLLPPVPGM